MLVPQHILEMVEELGKVKGKVLKVVPGIYPHSFQIWENVGGGSTKAYGKAMDAFELYEMLRSNIAPPSSVNGNGDLHTEDTDEVISHYGLNEPH